MCSGIKMEGKQKQMPQQTSSLRRAVRKRRCEDYVDYQDEGVEGGEGGLELKKVAVSVQCCTAFKHLSVHSGTD